MNPNHLVVTTLDLRMLPEDMIFEVESNSGYHVVVRVYEPHNKVELFLRLNAEMIAKLPKKLDKVTR